MRRLRPWAAVAALLALAGLTAAHAAVRGAGADYTGPLLPLDHLFDLALALGVFFLGTALGRHLLRRIGPDLRDPLDVLAFSTAVGLGVLSTLILGLGLLGGLHGWFMMGVGGAVAAVAHRELAGLPALLARIPASVRGSGADDRWLAAAWTVFGLAAAFLLCYGSAPPTDWDALMYHLEVPARFLQAGRVVLPPDNLHATVAGLVHMLYLPLLAAGSEAGPTLLNVLLTLLLGLTVFRVGSHIFGGDTGALAMILLWGTTTILLVTITPRTDVSVAFFLLLGHYALLRGFEATRPPSAGADGVGSVADDRSASVGNATVGPLAWVALGALMLGFAVGVKFNALAYAAVLAPVAVWILVRSGAGPRAATKALLFWGALGGVAMAPWLLKNLILVGAPFYPFLTPRFAEPWLDALFPGGSAVDVVGLDTLRLLRAVQSPFQLLGVFFSPRSMNVEAEGAHYFLSRAFLLLPAWALLFKERRLALLLAPALAYAVLAVYLDVPNVRYLVPAAPALTVGVAWIAVELGRRWTRGVARPLWLAAVCVVALWPTVRTVRLWLRTVQAPAYAVGTLSANGYLRAHPNFGPFAPVVEHLNAELPGDARLLLLFEGRGFPIHRDVIQDNKISNWPILAAAREAGNDPCLTRAPFDHVLLASAAVRYYEIRGLDPRVLRLDDFEEFRSRCLVEVWQGQGYVLFRRRGADGG